VILVLVLAVACAVASVSLVALRALAPRRETRATMARVAAYGVGAADVQEAPRARVSLTEPLARIGLRITPEATLDSLARKLGAAGLVRKTSPQGFVAMKTASALVFALFGLALGSSSGSVARSFVVVLTFGVGGFLTPDVLLNARIRRRREQILEELPNALDLLSVSVEAGLGLDASVARLIDATTGPLADELGLLLAELCVGATRQEVLRRFADRVPAPETAAFVRAVIHADQLGTSLTSTLRIQAREARARRQSIAEEKAGKAPVRMLVPTVFFIFPALFVVVLGPAVLFLLKAF
jgi:tight adherence protein C